MSSTMVSSAMVSSTHMSSTHMSSTHMSTMHDVSMMTTTDIDSDIHARVPSNAMSVVEVIRTVARMHVSNADGSTGRSTVHVASNTGASTTADDDHSVSAYAA